MSIVDSLRPQAGLRVLVTAGAGGIGAAIARAFHDVGSQVHVCDIDRSALDRLVSTVPGITGSMADVSVAADVDLVFDDVRGTLGGLDVLVNNACIPGPTGPIESIDAAGWERTIAVNLHSQYYFARRAVPLLRRSTAHPGVIATGSVAGRPGDALRTPQASSRWATVGLVRSLATELGPQGVRVNAILPGRVDAERMREWPLGRISLRRGAGFEDVAAVALFLCSPAARHLTGQAIGVDGHLDPL